MQGLQSVFRIHKALHLLFNRDRTGHLLIAVQANDLVLQYLLAVRFLFLKSKLKHPSFTGPFPFLTVVGPLTLVKIPLCSELDHL